MQPQSPEHHQGNDVVPLGGTGVPKNPNPCLWEHGIVEMDHNRAQIDETT